MSRSFTTPGRLASDIQTAFCYGGQCSQYLKQDTAMNRANALAYMAEHSDNRYFQSAVPYFVGDRDAHQLKHEMYRNQLQQFRGNRYKQFEILGYITLLLLCLSILVYNIPCDSSKNACFYGTTVVGNIVYAISGLFSSYTFAVFLVNGTF